MLAGLISIVTIAGATMHFQRNLRKPQHVSTKLLFSARCSHNTARHDRRHFLDRQKGSYPRTTIDRCHSRGEDHRTPLQLPPLYSYTRIPTVLPPLYSYTRIPTVLPPLYSYARIPTVLPTLYSYTRIPTVLPPLYSYTRIPTVLPPLYSYTHCGAKLWDFCDCNTARVYLPTVAQ